LHALQRPANIDTLLRDVAALLHAAEQLDRAPLGLEQVTDQGDMLLLAVH